MSASVVVGRDPLLAPAPGTRLVVAVGSNAAPNVLRRKLGHLEPSGVIHLRRVRVANITVGHSAHVAVRGYVPAAPVHTGHDTLETVAAWLSPLQTEALDLTEPNYDRRTVNTHDHPLILGDPMHPHDGPATPDEFDIYVSRHGVLADPATGTPLPFGSQSRVVAWLEQRLQDAALRGSASEVCTRLATADHASRITGLMKTTGLARSAWPAGARGGVA
ncbi:hypothetical protein [Gordonia westfalica]|uniref:Uncharacterized protein n=1 Tax=Gordonia westfalica TaxID=158898 RepID=A0A1H2IXY3_9ACTN|nr:hypothetical protein [Gordonia westfalica]SDU48795.1 hypothetical protein SAMN04488548_1341534 [Gordonia westfalica]